MNTSTTYVKSYALRRLGQQPYAEVTFPWIVVEAEARAREITPEELLRDYILIAEYGSGHSGITYTFAKKE